MRCKILSFSAWMLPALLLCLFWACNRADNQAQKGMKSELLIQAERQKNSGAYDSALVSYTELKNAASQTNDKSLWNRSVLAIADCYRGKAMFDTALLILNRDMDQARKTDDTTDNYFNLLVHKKANLLYDLQEYSQSEVLYNRNISLIKPGATADDTILALAHNGLGTSYFRQNKLANALIQYSQAVSIYEKSNQTKSSNYASSLQNCGIVCTSSGNFDKTEQYFLRALKVNQDVLAPDDLKLGGFYLNLGHYYLSIRNDAKAQEYLEKAEKIYSLKKQTNSLSAGAVFLNMGVLYIYTAEYEKAISYLNKSLEINTTKSPNNKGDLMKIYLNLGYISEKKGELERARQYYEQGLEAADKYANTIKILRGLAVVSQLSGSVKKAEEYHKLAIAKSIEMYGENHPETALSYQRYGEFLSSVNNKSALHYLTMALNYYERTLGGKSIDVAIAYHFIAKHYYRLGYFNEALENLQKSLVAGFPEFNSLVISDHPVVTRDNLNEYLLNPVILKAEILYSLYRKNPSQIALLKSSSDCYSLAIQMIEMLRSTYRDEDSKLFLSGNDQGTYLNALDANVRLYHVSPSESTLDNAFRISEKGKSAVLLSHLRDKRARDVGRIPSEMLKKEASLKSDIYSINKFIHDEQQKSKPDGQKINSWNSKLFDLSRSQDELVKSFEKDYPAYYNLKYDNSVVSVNELQYQLTQDQAVITYSVSDSVLYLFAIDKNQAQLVTQVLDTNFSDALHLVREQLNGAEFNNYTSDDFKQFVVKSAYLYQVLLKPVENIIHGKELVLVPDADLGYLSFDILLTSMPDTSRMNYRKLPYLIRQSAISYAPSATAFVANLKIRNQSNNGKVLAFSPSYGKDNIVLTKTDNEGQRLSSVLSDLNNTSEEIKNISEYFTTKTYIDKEATERNFKQYAPEFKILHLAMHTLVNNSNPLYSKLVFYSNTDNSTEDGLLNASELINMELNAELAVLSSCNTGSGKMQKGEGIMSLARDFFYAGVPGVVMTAWAVEDRSGVVLMKNFYKRIAEGKPRHEALRLAKLDYLEKSDMLTSHPHYWASYMNVGAISPISNSGSNGSKWLFILLPALVVISVIAIIYRKRRLHSRRTIGRLKL